MKNCKKWFDKVRYKLPMTVIFWYISKSVFSSFPVSAVHDFQGKFLIFLMPFSVSEFAGFKNIYVYVHI